jgi:DNA-binding CsgD family transcriptional regulator
MTAPVMASERDLRGLAAIVSQCRGDLPDGEGLSPSLLADLMSQVRCDGITLERYESGRQAYECLQAGPGTGRTDRGEDIVRAYCSNYWGSRFCSYPDRTGDLRSVIRITDFYSVRQWHSTGMYTDCIRPLGLEHALGLYLPGPPGPAAGLGGYVRLYLHRGPGPDFSERDRALLVLLRPHLHQAYLDAERRRRPVPQLTPRQNDLLYLVAAGHTNSQIARRLGISEGTVRTHLENIYERLNVSSRAAAVTRAFADRFA